MSVGILLVRGLLSAVFCISGIAKILDGEGTRRSMLDFGVPVALAGPLAYSLPPAELACALALLPADTAWWGASGALALLSVFTAAMLLNLARGRTPDCHCFGKLHSEAVSGSTVLRTVLLAGGAALVVWTGYFQRSPGFVDSVRGMGGSETLLLVLSLAVAAFGAFGAVILVQLLAQNGRMMLRIEELETRLGGRTEPSVGPAGLAVGADAPSFSLIGLDSIPVALATLQEVGKPILLFFSEPGCSACETVLPDVASWQREFSDRVLVVPISRGDVAVNMVKSMAHGLEHVLLQVDREVGEAYKVTGTPSAVLIKDGLIASPLAAGAAEIRALVFDATLPPPAKKGDPTPSLQLPDLDDKAVDLAAGRGGRRVLMFWNPSCGFCQSMLKDLKAWERTRRRTAPELLVISTGTSESNREQGFRSKVLLDPSFGAGRVFGATGTPSAVLLEADGTIGSEVVVGAPAVLGLLGVVTPDPVSV